MKISAASRRPEDSPEPSQCDSSIEQLRQITSATEVADERGQLPILLEESIASPQDLRIHCGPDSRPDEAPFEEVWPAIFAILLNGGLAGRVEWVIDPRSAAVREDLQPGDLTPVGPVLPAGRDLHQMTQALHHIRVELCSPGVLLGVWEVDGGYLLQAGRLPPRANSSVPVAPRAPRDDDSVTIIQLAA